MHCAGHDVVEDAEATRYAVFEKTVSACVVARRPNAAKRSPRLARHYIFDCVAHSPDLANKGDAERERERDAVILQERERDAVILRGLDGVIRRADVCCDV